MSFQSSKLHSGEVLAKIDRVVMETHQEPGILSQGFLVERIANQGFYEKHNLCSSMLLEKRSSMQSKIE